ncbi:MAG: hypothetical protein QNJ70_13315 [Xenococcaceae cyanobacterium MO_207.B15]|nr:hypothetical protein [Xenococcaceae cyanobacterium MO_207.B15]
MLSRLKYICLWAKIPVEDAGSDLAVKPVGFNGSPLFAIKIANRAESIRNELRCGYFTYDFSDGKILIFVIKKGTDVNY